MRNLSLVSADLSAELLNTNLKVRDFMQLKVGDIMPSEKKINLPIEVYVNKCKILLARPGLSGKKRAFQVIKVCDYESKES